MDSRINSSSPVGPVIPRHLGERPQQDERSFLLPRQSDTGGNGEQEEEGADDPGLLAPQPRREAPAVSRVRLDDEAGQRIDVRG